MAFNEIDSTNLESTKANRKKVSSPRWGGSNSAGMTKPKGKKKSKRGQKKNIIR